MPHSSTEELREVTMRILLVVLLFTIAVQGLASALRNQVQSLVGKRLTSSLAIIGKINAVDEHGRSALSYAAELGDLQLVKFLVTNGANVDKEDKSRLLPFEYAVREAEINNTNQQFMIVSYLLEKTSGVYTDERGWPALNWAILAGNLQRVKEVISNGAKVKYTVLSHRARTFEVAKLMNDQKIIDYLLSVWGSAIFEYDIRDGLCAKIKEILDRGFDVNATDDKGETLLHKSVKYRSGSEEIVDLLLEYGANPNAVDNKGRTPLHIIDLQPLTIYQALLAAGADVNAVDNNGQTPMHTANWRHHKIGEILVEAGADVNAVDNNGQTPLHMVEWKWHTRSDFLLKAGANPNATDNNGQTPLDIATSVVHGAKIFELLQKVKADSSIATNNQ